MITPAGRVLGRAGAIQPVVRREAGFAAVSEGRWRSKWGGFEGSPWRFKGVEMV
jgi:hypothetical protein